MIITLCGSKATHTNTIFYWEDLFIKNGVTCILPALSYSMQLNNTLRNEDSTQTKKSQFNKIKLSDAILVILDKDEKTNISTIEEILYAHSLHKRIFFTKNNTDSEHLVKVKKEDWNDSFIENINLYEYLS